jgi:serine/threonine protein kinase
MQNDRNVYNNPYPGNSQPTYVRFGGHYATKPEVFNIIALGNDVTSPIEAIEAAFLGQQLGSYRLVRLLGHGGFAWVFLGEHLYLKRFAAIKILRQTLNAQEKERFLDEARLLATLTHPNIVRVLEFAVAQKVETIGNGKFVEYIPYLVMDFAPGGSLRALNPAGSCLFTNTVVNYIRQAADALQYAHDKGIIHRDVKPENLLLNEQHEVMLSDFGLALFAPRPDLLSTQETTGTLPYTAPEQLRGKPSFASDQYSLAVVAYEWLCGRRPFEGDDVAILMQHISSPPPSLRRRNLAVSQAVEEVILKALAKDSYQRYPSVRDFARALEHASNWNDLAFSSYVHAAVTIPDWRQAASVAQPFSFSSDIAYKPPNEVEKRSNDERPSWLKSQPLSFVPKKWRKMGWATVIIALILLISVLGGSFVREIMLAKGEQPVSPSQTQVASASVGEADFSVQPVRVRDLVLVQNGAIPQNGFSVVGQGGQVVVDYTLTGNYSLTGPHKPILTVIMRGLVSRNGNDAGYAPISLLCNGQFIVQNFTLPGGGFNPETSSFQVPFGFLTRGRNRITFEVSSTSTTNFWIYDLKIMQG